MNFGSIDVFNRLEKSFADTVRILKSDELPCKELNFLLCADEATLLSKEDCGDGGFPIFQFQKIELLLPRVATKLVNCWPLAVVN